MRETANIQAPALPQVAPRTGWLGIGASGLIVLASIVTAIAYRGGDQEAYSPFNHFVSELGELGHSQLAIVFNLSLIAGATGLAGFVVRVSRAMPARFGTPFALAGVIAGLGGGLVGVFPMDFISIHRFVAMVFFLSGWVIVAIFSTWQVTDRMAPFPRWLLVEAALVVAAFISFLASMTTLQSEDTFVVLDRPGFWLVPALEWLALLSLLAWFALVGAVIVAKGRRVRQTEPAEQPARP